MTCPACQDSETVFGVCEHCLASDVTDWIFLADYEAMVDMALKHGQRPVKIYDARQHVLPFVAPIKVRVRQQGTPLEAA